LVCCQSFTCVLRAGSMLLQQPLFAFCVPLDMFRLIFDCSKVQCKPKHRNPKIGILFSVITSMFGRAHA